jgi:hypothetical protein
MCVKFIKDYSGIVIIELVTVTAIIISLTVMRFFFPSVLYKIMTEYNKYADFDADVSIVYGEDN